ncbi:hypothetical protein DW674_03085 [Mitsuokella multacida]|uniref:Uncharacterized protein n=1 Tax=Mitsuokella multacida TaxID=52226 RepID=A0A414NYY4_9FIRM|nr:hypothetical protein DW674_03085 [Mitsuokella multacida]
MELGRTLRKRTELRPGDMFRLQEQRGCPKKRTELRSGDMFRLQERRGCPQGWPLILHEPQIAM